MLSLWSRYRDGAFHCATGADADIVSYLEANPDVTFEVSDNEPPYRGVSGAGTGAIERGEDKALPQSLLDRYLGGTDSDLATRHLAKDREEVRLRLDPSNLYTWDFSDRLSDGEGQDKDR